MNISDSFFQGMARILVFETCSDLTESVYQRDFLSANHDDELVLMIMEAKLDVCDKLIHGIVAFIYGFGFELLRGFIHPENSGVSLKHRSFTYDVSVSQSSGSIKSDMQYFVAYFKRLAPKTETVNHSPVSDIRNAIRLHLTDLLHSRSADSVFCLCSEDLVGIKELTLIPQETTSNLPTKASEWPITYKEWQQASRLKSQPLQGFGHRPSLQTINPIRYKLTIIGVNQTGLLTYVHSMLMHSGFRIVSGDIDTIRSGSYAHNTYIVETFNGDASERLLRANFQSVIPIPSPVRMRSDPFLFKSQDTQEPSTECGIWLGDFEAYFGGFEPDMKKNGFGRYWKSRNKISLSNFSYEGDWKNDTPYGFGFQLVDEGKSISYSFGLFHAGELIDGTIMYPFEPPMKSVRVVPNHQPNICLYRVLIQRSEFWLRQMPKSERPIRYLPAGKIRSGIACYMRSGWTKFSESPIPSITSMSVFQIAAVLEACGLPHAAKAAFSKRVDGGLLEAMDASQLMKILNLNSHSQVNLLSQFLRTLAKAYSIDRHMRQPSAVMDALVNPSVGGKIFPLDKMRLVDNLGQGAYGKVVYAEFRGSAGMDPATLLPIRRTSISRMTSNNSLGSRDSDAQQPSLISALTRRSTIGGLLTRVASAPSLNTQRPNLFVALKEQVGGGALMENSCELVREWATLNALPHENIVKLEGICADTDAPMFNKRYLATALIEASLPSLIYREQYSQAPELTPLLILRLAGDIASGLSHMHSMNIMHGDIKSPNVLVDLRTSNRPTGRICDFGHAAIRIGPRPQRRMCTFGWASPESLRDSETDLSSDVWSWAVVVWEMYLKEIPWKSCSHPQMLAAVGYCGLDPSGYMDMHIPVRLKAEKKFSEICKKCFAFDPALRPSMSRVLKFVDKLGRYTARKTWDNMHSLLQ